MDCKLVGKYWFFSESGVFLSKDGKRSDRGLFDGWSGMNFLRP